MKLRHFKLHCPKPDKRFLNYLHLASLFCFIVCRSSLHFLWKVALNFSLFLLLTNPDWPALAVQKAVHTLSSSSGRPGKTNPACSKPQLNFPVMGHRGNCAAGPWVFLSQRTSSVIFANGSLCVCALAYALSVGHWLRFPGRLQWFYDLLRPQCPNAAWHRRDASRQSWSSLIKPLPFQIEISKALWGHCTCWRKKNSP